MEEDMKANILMIKNTELEHFIGQIEENIMVHGKMVNNMEEDNTIQLLDKKRPVNGFKAKE
jgi:hypothetical protein